MRYTYKVRELGKDIVDSKTNEVGKDVGKEVGGRTVNDIKNKAMCALTKEPTYCNLANKE